MSDLGVISLATLVLAALLVGVSKTAISGVGALSVALFAAVLPAKESTGALLPLLLVGDVLAVRAYRKHTDWPALLRLMPSVAAGVLLGVAFVAVTEDTVIRRTIGVLLLTIVLHHVWRHQRSRRARERRASGGTDAETDRAAGPRRGHTLLFGLLAGFATMVANAGGPAMSLYLLASGFTMLGFLGTGAWFFLIVNLFKLPFSIALGLVTPDALALDAVLALAVPAGALIGRAVVHRIEQAVFARLVLLFTALSSVNLLR
ncbi:sulfite exporter TauE/SafE family protein [Streptomyces inhibens]|uniref:Probable membrane transporter protein n=1 Tax=Streptomyces inhibens TaxID=2293571 RepID=A0A371PT14_STRIH|nr:sulfite exporter TauE/SafE family protein [Streptomyces inhibens]REK85628.1 sulfite exporter TauE/SafE family protein [Streptomyces inhibens]